MMKRILSILLVFCCMFALFGNAVAESSAVAAELSSDPYSFQLAINGELYAFPMTYADFTAKGWVYDGDASAELDSGYYSSTEVFQQGDLRCYAAIINFDNCALPINQCYIGGISFDEYNVKKVSDFSLTLPGGLEYGKATVEQTQALYGTPSDVKEGYQYIGLTYTYASYCDLRFKFSTETGVLNSVKLRHLEAPADFVSSEVSNDVPSIVAAYSAPAAISGSLADFTASYGGKVYQLPVPVSVMLDNGWKLIEADSDATVSGRDFGWVTLMLDNQRLRVLAHNYSPSATAISYCFVTDLKSDDSNCKVDMTIAKGITIGMTEADLLAALEGETFKKEESTSNTCYNVSPTESSPDSYKIYVKDGTVYRLVMSNCPKYADYTAGK